MPLYLANFHGLHVVKKIGFINRPNDKKCVTVNFCIIIIEINEGIILQICFCEDSEFIEEIAY